MPTSAPRRRAPSRRRLAVTVTAPDGAVPATRGLASWLSKAAPAKASGEVTVALVSDGRMRSLNRSFRGKDYATDVLSFPADAPATAGERGVLFRRAPAGESRSRREAVLPREARSSLGDIVIATGVASRQADEAHHPVSVEIKVLALHGLLHLLGYDHDKDDGEMARTESRLRRKAGLKEGLIARTSR
jgi:probable rRNA maturation factor